MLTVKSQIPISREDFSTNQIQLITWYENYRFTSTFKRSQT